MTLFASVQQWWFGRGKPRPFDQLTDTELLYSFGNTGNTAVLEALIERHCDALFHFLKSLADLHLAEDISQQVWLKVIENPERYQSGPALFRTWLFTIARNTLVDELRRQNRWQWQPLETADTGSDDVEEQLRFTQREDLQLKFNNALADLPFAQREALMLQLEGFSLKDISHITQENQETIKSRLRFARKALIQALEGSQ